MKKRYRLVTDQEWEQIKKQRDSTAFLDAMAKRMHEADKRRADLIASPPPPGYIYRCTECGHPTNASDRKCVCTLF